MVRKNTLNNAKQTLMIYTSIIRIFKIKTIEQFVRSGRLSEVYYTTESTENRFCCIISFTNPPTHHKLFCSFIRFIYTIIFCDKIEIPVVKNKFMW